MLGAALTWRVERARSLRWIFVVYLVACLACFFIPSAIGENVARLRYAAMPLAVLDALAAPLAAAAGLPRRALPRRLLEPDADRVQHPQGRSDPASNAAYWAPAIAFLHAHLEPSYRVEAVDTTGHWPAVYLAEAEIPLARGGSGRTTSRRTRCSTTSSAPPAYLAWLRGLGVRYVVLTNAPPDYSARDEAALLRSGRSGLRPVLQHEEPDGARGAGPAPDPDRAGARTRAAPDRDPHRRRPRSGGQLPPRRALLALLGRERRLPDPPRRRDDHDRGTRPGRLELAFRVHPGSALAAAVVGERSRVCDLDWTGLALQEARRLERAFAVVGLRRAS